MFRVAAAVIAVLAFAPLVTQIAAAIVPQFAWLPLALLLAVGFVRWTGRVKDSEGIRQLEDWANRAPIDRDEDLN